MTTFVSRPRKKPPTLLVVHESGGPGDVEQLIGTLQSKANGVHYIIGRDGQLFELADPEHEIVAHITTFNPDAIGIELPNPVSADAARGAAFAKRLESQGSPGHIIEHSRVRSGLGNRVIFYNPLAQCETFYRLVRQLMRRFATVPARIGPLQPDGFLFGRLPSEVWQGGGLFPHGAWAADGHFDGFFPILYLVARQAGLAPEKAWATSIEITESAVPHKPISLTPYFKTGLPDSLPAARAQELVLAQRRDMETRARATAAPGQSPNKGGASTFPSVRPTQGSPTVASSYNRYAAATVATVSINTSGKLYDFDSGEWV